MGAEEYKLKIGKHEGKTIAEVPIEYLLNCWDKNYYMETPVRRYVSNHLYELREKLKLKRN